MLLSFEVNFIDIYSHRILTKQVSKDLNIRHVDDVT